MKVNVNLNGDKRKKLAQAIGGVMIVEPLYKGPPTYSYEVGSTETGIVVIDRNAMFTMTDEISIETQQQILACLEQHGYEYVISEEPKEDADMSSSETQVTGADKLEAVESAAAQPRTTETRHTDLQNDKTDEVSATKSDQHDNAIFMPINGFDETALNNLTLLVISKSTLIKKALGVDALPIEQTDTTLCFPWFDRTLEHNETAAYIRFIAALCDMAKKQTRVLATDKAVDNEKYAFRCFLLRLGFIGEEYAESRRILLKNLSGNGSWKGDNPSNVRNSSHKAKPKHSSKNERIRTHSPQRAKTPPFMPNLLKRLFQ